MAASVEKSTVWVVGTLVFNAKNRLRGKLPDVRFGAPCDYIPVGTGISQTGSLYSTTFLSVIIHPCDSITAQCI
jgi:hypothetical protein